MGERPIPLAAQLARHCLREPDGTARARARHHIAAWVGASALAAATPLATRLHAGLAGLAAPGDPWHTVLFEASLGSLFEMDDTHRQALVHPAPVIVPVTLAVGRALRRSGPQVLDAMVRGYEAMIRLGMSVGPTHYQYWHNTSSCGAVGAAVAAASLLQLDEAQTTHAICLALVQSSGLWQTRLDACDAKPWHLARTAQTGVQAAYLAQAGVSGPAHALEGEKGFYAATCPDANPQALTRPQGPDWQIFATSFKPWAACRHAHPAIDAALTLRHACEDQASDLPWSEVAAIEIGTYADALAFCDRPDPVDAGEARFSLHHAVSVSLLRGSPAPDDFDLAAIQDAAIARLRSVTRLALDAGCAQRYPQHFGAVVTVHWPCGRTRVEAVQDTLGDPEKPLSDSALWALADQSLAQAGWSAERRHRHLAGVRSMADEAAGPWQAHLTPLRPLTPLAAG